MNARTEQKKRSHESILESASRLVRQRGIGGARVADVMQGAALTVGGFYAHFASKDELVDEALRRTAHMLREKLFARLEEKPEADRAEVILKRYLSPDHRDAATLGCPLPAVAGEVGTTAPQHGAVVEEQLELLASSLAEHLPPGGIVPHRALALGLVALMYGGLTLARAVRGSPLSDEVLRACRALGRAAVRREQEVGSERFFPSNEDEAGSATLIHGGRDAALVDPSMTPDEARAVATRGVIGHMKNQLAPRRRRRKR